MRDKKNAPIPSDKRIFVFCHFLSYLLFFSLLIVFYVQVVAIEDGIGEVFYPIAKDKHARLVGELEVELYVAMPEEEIVYVGVRLEVVFGIEHKVLFVLAHVGWLQAVGTLEARVFCPRQAEGYAEVGVQPGEEALTETVAEDGAYEVKLRVGVAKSVAVCEVEGLAIKFHGAGLLMEYQSALFLQIVIRPDIVVARKEMHFHAKVGELGELAEEARVALGHYVAILVPEVEHIAKEIYGFCLVFYLVEEIDKATFLHPSVGNGEGT